MASWVGAACIPAGKGLCLVMLRKLVGGCRPAAGARDGGRRLLPPLLPLARQALPRRGAWHDWLVCSGQPSASLLSLSPLAAKCITCTEAAAAFSLPYLQPRCWAGEGGGDWG